MGLNMSKRALLKFCPLEYRYQDRYGIMPDYDIDRHIADGMTGQEANDLVNGRLADLWQEMKEEHESGFRSVESGDGCPF